MQFKLYQKIHRLGSDENEGILTGTVYIQEKIDGANTQIFTGDGKIQLGSRNQSIGEGSFNGFQEYVQAHEGIKKLTADHPDWRLFGEWLVRHTLSYDETSFKKWYLFDICNEKEEFLDLEEVYKIAQEYSILTPKLFLKATNPTLDQIQPFVGKSELGPKGEGVVIKNFDFINKWGVLSYAKLVTQEFKEDNSLVFGGNRKDSDSYWEQWAVNKFLDISRIRKIINKTESITGNKIRIEDTPRVIGTAYHDMITEEIWEIQKKVTGNFNFKVLARIAQKKAAKIFHDILNNQISVAYGENT